MVDPYIWDKELKYGDTWQWRTALQVLCSVHCERYQNPRPQLCREERAWYRLGSSARLPGADRATYGKCLVFRKEGRTQNERPVSRTVWHICKDSEEIDLNREKQVCKLGRAYNLSCIHLFNKYSLSIYCVSGKVLSIQNTSVNKIKILAHST